MMRIRTFSALLLSGALLASPNLANAQTSPEAQAVIDQNNAFVARVQTAYGDISTTASTNETQAPGRSQVWAQMPDKLVTRTETPTGLIALYLDGPQMATYIQQKNQYYRQQLPAPRAASDLRAMIDGGLGPKGELAGTSETRQITLIGKEPVVGIPCNHLHVELTNGTSSDLWIADGPAPLPVFQRINRTQPQPLNTETYARWVLNQPIPPQAFQFVAPPKAKAFDARTTAPTVGQMAPDCEVVAVQDGTPLKLSSLRGKVVYIDFWATWCPPCQLAMRDLDQLARHQPEGWKDRVVLMGFSIDQSREIVRSHLLRNAWDAAKHYWCTTRGATSPADQLFGVSGVPTGFVIGRDGKILWSGSPGDIIRSEIEKALAAK